MYIETNINKKAIIYLRRYFGHWKAFLALRTNRGCVNLEKSASRSFIKLSWFKKENVFFMFVPNQVTQTLTFYAEVTLRVLFLFYSFLRYSDVNENLNLPVTIVYNTVMAIM